MTDSIIYCKLTILKLIEQCAHRCMIEGKPAFHNLCESAFEWAWNALGFEENYVYAEDFYMLYDEIWTELNKSQNIEPPPISMLEMFRERSGHWAHEWEDEEEYTDDDITIKSGYIPYTDGGY